MTNRSWTLKTMMVSAVLGLSLLSLGVTNSFAVPVGNTYARADPEPYTPPGNVDCVGLTDIADVAQIECQLYDDVNCTVGSGSPCATDTDNIATSPPLYSDVPGECDPCNEYRVSFNPVAEGADTTPENELHFKILFKDASGELIDVNGKDIRVHSFLVVPESPIGAAALILSTLAALGAFMFLKGRKSDSNLPILP
jgi:hypothetical protein